MTNLITPPLILCPFCGAEPTERRTYQGFDYSYALLRIECRNLYKCGHSTRWVKYNPENLNSRQNAIDTVSQEWNNYGVPSNK
jgi:hypothetical protein